jgi:hypothetical protein
VDEESILGNDEVWSSQAGWTVPKAITFDPTVGSRLNFYRSFLDELFHAVDEESILDDDEFWSSQAGWTGRKAITFDPTVGWRSNFYRSFRMNFSTHWIRNRYSVMIRSGRARLDGRFERARTFDPTVGSRSNFYRSFPDELFHAVDEESILDDDEVWSSQAGWTG